MFCRDFPDDRGLASERMPLDGFEDGVGALLPDNRDEFALVCDIEWVKPENLAGAPDFLGDRKGRFLLVNFSQGKTGVNQNVIAGRGIGCVFEADLLDDSAEIGAAHPKY